MILRPILDPFCLKLMPLHYMTFIIWVSGNLWWKKKKIGGGGTPRSGPLKILKFQNFQKMTPMTPYNPIFLLQNHLVLSKLGCLQKTRAQNIKIWTNGGHFCDDKGFLWSPRSIFKKMISRSFLEIFLISFLILASWA